MTAALETFSLSKRFRRGWALREQGQCEEGVAQLGEGLVAYRATGAELECSHWLALLAEAYRDTGQPEKALRLPYPSTRQFLACRCSCYRGAPCPTPTPRSLRP